MATIFLFKYVSIFRYLEHEKQAVAFYRFCSNQSSLSSAFGVVQGGMISVVSCGIGY